MARHTITVKVELTQREYEFLQQKCVETQTAFREKGKQYKWSWKEELAECFLLGLRQLMSKSR